VRAFKSFSARHVNEFLISPGVHLWQRNYYEHIIRDNDELNRIHTYIESNPAAWETDAENPTRINP
jgi:REP element-mobilizing transposase RayT